MENKKVIGAVILMALMVIAVGYVIATSSKEREITQTGIISSVDIQVYSDAACTLNLTSIYWGTVDSPSTNTQTIYVKNIGSKPITLDFNDDAPTDYLIEWNQQETQLNTGESVAAIITLSVGSGIAPGSTFNFNTYIIGTQT